MDTIVPLKDLRTALERPPSLPGLFVAKYYSLKRVLSSVLVYLRLLRLQKTAEHPFLPAALQQRRRRVVVCGGGFASVAFVSNLDFTQYEVVWVSSSPLFSFTPLLPSCIGGVLHPSTCSVPLRTLLVAGGDPNARGVYRQGTLVSVDYEKKTARCLAHSPSEGSWEEPFDFLVIGIGGEVKTFGIPGVEQHALFLRNVDDAQRIRERLQQVMERAAAPTATDEIRRQLLQFVIVGGGPAGVEAAAELGDFLEGEAARWYPELRRFFSILVVDSGDRLLKSYKPQISNGALLALQKNKVEVLFNSLVVSVAANSVVIRSLETAAKDKVTSGSGETSVPCGLVLWAAGVQPSKIAGALTEALSQQYLLPEQQERQSQVQLDTQKRLLVDPSFRVLGTDGVFAFGDCCTVSPPPLSLYARQLFLMASEGNKEGLADPVWLSSQQHRMALLFPQILDGAAEISAVEKCSGLTEEEFSDLLTKIDRSYLPPVPTAQNAKRQGEFLALIFNSMLSRVSAGGLVNDVSTPSGEAEASDEVPGSSSVLSLLPAFIEQRGVALCFVGAGQAAVQLPFLTFVGTRTACTKA
ncbi:Non-proton pumping type-II NADH dehydrogenase I [Cyclospora cayetanensis]|uniref:NADH:ubiquinone reductase (non-electrogenic) n=1 Tax=Cyclospora cayetanensis TaxID=88456 RepID=A0A1D3DAV0_9EIME|nr:Non-proton pumping type-II NADH dehydrogenase I [Cyclospora cayetanensis]